MLASLVLSFISGSAFAAFPAVDRSTAVPILIVHPAEKANVGPDGEWVLGSVADPKTRLTINGEAVTPYRTGAFLVWLPVQPGTFTFHAEATLPDGTTAAFDRGVLVSPPAPPLPAKPVQIDKDSVAPRADLELRPGDWLVVRFRGTPGKTGRFRLHGRPWQPMRESNPALGLYEGAYLVRESDESSEPRPIELKLDSASAKSGAKVAVRAGTPLVAQVRGVQPVNVKTGPGEGEFFAALGGTRFLTAGRVGGETRVVLGGGQTGSIDTKHLEFLPEGAAPPRAETDAVTVRPAADATTVRIGVTDRVPFIVDESDDLRSITIRLHYTYAHTNWIVYGSPDSLVEEVRLRQEMSDIVAVTVRLRPGRRIWGWQAAFDGSGIKLELRKAPTIAKQALSGRSIFLDPGHMPSAHGATGGLGTREMDVNFAIAKAVEALLIKEGAKPIMSRRSADDEVGLQERPRAAAEKRAEIFVSIHNNNVPDGRNPVGATHGYSVFYYQPHSFELARAMYGSYKKHVPLPGEDLRYGSLLVARMTAMPAILTETAYLTYPDQEELLLDAGFRQKTAQAIVDGIRTFLEQERARQKNRKEDEE